MNENATPSPGLSSRNGIKLVAGSKPASRLTLLWTPDLLDWIFVGVTPCNCHVDSLWTRSPLGPKLLWRCDGESGRKSNRFMRVAAHLLRGPL